MAKRYYDGMEKRDGGMISKDMNAMACMPQDVKMVYFPKDDSGMPEDYGDSLNSIDKQMSYDKGKVKANLSKY